MTGLILALDTVDIAQARRWADATAPSCGMVKVGLKFFAANGPQGVRAVGDRPVFLDLKLHDIPNTVAGAVRALMPLAPRFLTVHAAGEAKMIRAAREAVEAGGTGRPRLLAVTVLTSLASTPSQVLHLAEMALSAGADGIVCSGHDVPAVREAFGPKPVLVVPGIRPAGSAADDQARTTTPREAARAGADWLVVGRPITHSSDPAAAAAAIAAEVAG
jgi:orotidine-5'-phosphate decarboxylase